MGMSPVCARITASRLRLRYFALLALCLLLVAVAGPSAPGQAAANGPLLHLRGGSFDPLLDAPALPTALSDEPQLYLVQFVGPVHADWKVAVAQAGAQLYDYIPDYAFLARMDRVAAQRVQALAPVRWVGIYQPAYRLEAALRAPTLQAGQQLTLTVETLPAADLDALAAQIASLGGHVQHRAHNTLAGYLRVVLPAAALPPLASHTAVRWLESYHPPTVQNDVGGGQIMQAGRVWRDVGLYGSGQVVAVADTGLDTGDPDTLHPDIRGRLLQAYALGRPGDWSDLGMPRISGHGTHVAGSVLGNGALSGGVSDTFVYGGTYAGVAPAASLVFQSIGDSGGGLGGIPADYADLMRQAYQDGARIHSNSWGGLTGGANNPYGAYTTASRQVDQAMWEHPDMLVLYTAGNQGTDADRDGVIDRDSILSPGTAKNILTVGASETVRPEIRTGYTSDRRGLLYTRPVFLDRMTDNADGMAAFSSRGPTDDGRIKPDVVAPGTYIVSLRAGDNDGWSTLGEAELAEAGGPLDTAYVLQGGTSMAAALTAGGAALVREWLTRVQDIAAPSGALIKAVLINGAAQMAPGQYGTEQQQEIPTSQPNPVSGWGRVDLAASLGLDDTRTIWLRDNLTGLATGATATYTLTVAQLPTLQAAEPLRVTLAWTDYPAAAVAGRALVNDLDLEIIAPTGQRYTGNQAAAISSECVRAGGWDACNNVEGIVIDPAPAGDYSLRVHAYNVPQNERQPFALVAAWSATSQIPLKSLYLPLIVR